MTSTTGHDFADVVLPFPFTDQRTTKRRPAVVVSSGRYHRDRPDLIILAVTSQVRAAPAVGEAAVAHWKEAGLHTVTNRAHTQGGAVGRLHLAHKGRDTLAILPSSAA